jgi:hypothetical protein
MQPIKVVLRYTTGTVIKGFTQNFSPTRKSFHFQPVSGNNGPIEIPVNELKAVFFVRDFSGNSLYNERKEYFEGDPPSGRKVEVKFMDGEVMVGSTLSYESNRPGFFIFPADPNSNNIKAFIVNSSVIKVEYL